MKNHDGLGIISNKHTYISLLFYMNIWSKRKKNVNNNLFRICDSAANSRKIKLIGYCFVKALFETYSKCEKHSVKWSTRPSSRLNW